MGPQAGASMFRKLSANLYLVAVAAAGAAVIGLSALNVMAEDRGHTHLPWLGIAILTVLTGHMSLRLPLANCRVSFSDCFMFLSLLLFGPHLATLTGALDGFASSSRSARGWHKTVFNTAAMAISINLASSLFGHVMPGDLLASRETTLGNLALAMLLLAVAQFVLNTALVSGAAALKEGASFVAIWEGSLPWAGTGYLSASAVVILVFAGIRVLGAGAVVAVLPFPVILYFAYRGMMHQLARVSARH